MKTSLISCKLAGQFCLGVLLPTLATTIHAQPSRPFVGIYSHTAGPPSGATVAANFDANPYLSGITVKVGWNSIQPTSADSFTWTGVGDILTVAGERGKRVHLAIIPGFTTPTWVYGAPHYVPFLNDVNVSGTVGDAPIPWNPTYVALFDALIDSFASYLSTHPYKSALAAIEVMGHHYRGEEMHAPSVSTFTAQGFSVTYNDVYSNWQHWIDKFEQTFPEQELILVISQTYTGTGTDGSNLAPLLDDISQYFVDTTLPSGRAIIQTDQLDGRKNSVSGVTPARCIFFNTTPYTGADAVPNGHEMVGNFRTQPYRQGRPAMTVFNFKAMLNPYYMQIWSGNITDLWVAKDLLKEWYRYRNNTVAEMQADLTARGLYLATSNYGTGNTAPQADDTRDTTANGTPKVITLSYDDTSTLPDAASDFRITQAPAFGTLSAISFAGGVATVTYTPTSSNVIDTFRWEATDTSPSDFNVAAQRSNFAVATIEVGTVPHDPEFLRDPISSDGLTPPVPPATVNAAYSGTIGGQATDVDAGATLTYSKDSGPAWLSISSTGALSGTPGVSDAGANRWVVAVTDNTGRQGFATLVIKVQADVTPPAAPTGLAATAGGAQVSLDWNNNAEPDLAGYNVFRATTSGGPYSQVNGALLTASSYVDSGLTNGTPYYYVVKAVDSSANESGYSNQASATPTAPNTPPTISNIGDQTINEDGNTGAVAFSVSDAETAVGSLTVTSGSSNTTLVPTANIVFGGSGASRTVTVTPAANQSGTATITVTVSDGSLTASDTFLLTVNAVNDAPTISNIADQTINEDGNTGAVAFTVGDAETAVGLLTVTGGSSNTTLVPTANIVFGGSGASRTVTVTPAANQSGTATITVTVSDGSLTASDTFLLTVNAVNDAPSIGDILDQTIAANGTTGALAFTVGDAETAVGSLALTGASTNTTLVPTANIVFGGSGASRTVTVTPAANQTGTATITVTVSDGTLTASDTFLLTVNAPPVVTLLEDGFETDFSKWTDGGATDWDRTTAQKNTGSYSAHAGSADNDLVSDDLNTTGYSTITIEFWYRDDDIDDADDIYLQLYNGSTYANKFELGNSTEDTWQFYTVTLNNTGGDAQYFRSNFRIKFEGTSIDSNENLWIDDVKVTAQ